MKNIQENNKLIAEFIGGEYTANEKIISLPRFMKCDHYDREGILMVGLVLTKALRFHESWDWLMPVVQKCKDNQVFGSQYLIDQIDNVLTCDCQIELLYEAVIEFIKWYNENK